MVGAAASITPRFVTPRSHAAMLRELAHPSRRANQPDTFRQGRCKTDWRYQTQYRPNKHTTIRTPGRSHETRVNHSPTTNWASSTAASRASSSNTPTSPADAGQPVGLHARQWLVGALHAHGDTVAHGPLAARVPPLGVVMSPASNRVGGASDACCPCRGRTSRCAPRRGRIPANEPGPGTEPGGAAARCR